MNNLKEFPWTYDQFQRYLVLREFIRVFYGNKKIKVLDVGGLSPDKEGKKFWLPLKHVFSGFCVILDLEYFKEKNYVQGHGKFLPFKENSFEVVSALDVIEHVPAKERGGFLKELCRVAKSSIIISAPFKDKNIQEVENLLFQQIKKLYGLEHVQLLEHKKYGLPEIKFVSEILRKYTKSGVNFYYGSLFNWLFLQTIKYCFMFKRNSERIHTLLDKMVLSHNFSSEFKPPFSRNFWIYSKDISQKELEKGIETIKKNLEKKIEFNFSDLIELNKKIVNFYSEDTVSAIIVTQGEKRNLQECLNHLLTQRVDFNLEVSVWDIKENHEIKEIIEKNYPGVKYFTTKKNEKTFNALFKIINQLKGNYILLISNNIILPLDSVKKFYSILKNSSDVNLLSPKIVEKEKINHVCFGKRNSFKKMFAGRMHKFFKSIKSQKIDWIFSECLFFKKEALFDRKLKSNTLTKRNIFLWEKIHSSKKFLYFPEITVHKQG